MWPAAARLPGRVVHRHAVRAVGVSEDAVTPVGVAAQAMRSRTTCSGDACQRSAGRAPAVVARHTPALLPVRTPGGRATGQASSGRVVTRVGCSNAAIEPHCGWGSVASTSTAKTSHLQRVTSADLDAWAQSSAVLGHTHSRPSCEPYALSSVREIGGGTKVPTDWSVRLLSAAGMKGGESLNQDSFSYTALDCGWIVCVACDGHGEQGEVIAERVTRMLPMLLSQYLPDMGMEEALPSAFLAAQADLERCFRSAQTYSGATVAMCCIHSERRQVWSAHAGDSRSVLGDMSNGAALFVTEEHKAHDPDEFRRLEEAGAQVIKKRYEDGDMVSRVFVPKTGVPGLAMSRSLGDGCLKKYGVVADPEVHNISKYWDKCASPFIVLASDGLWDTLSVEETLVEFSGRRRRGLDVIMGTEALLRRSQRLWIEAEGDYCDDVTLLFLAPSTSLVSSGLKPTARAQQEDELAAADGGIPP